MLSKNTKIPPFSEHLACTTSRYRYPFAHHSPSFVSRGKKARSSLWLRGENLGQGLGFCNFLPGKLPNTGTSYISSVRPPIVFFFFSFFVWLRNQSGDHLHPPSASRLTPSTSGTCLAGTVNWVHPGITSGIQLAPPGREPPSPRRVGSPGPVPMGCLASALLLGGLPSYRNDSLQLSSRLSA